MPLNKELKNVLVIGSGPIVIGQAAEFDYDRGTQACRALKEEGLEVVLGKLQSCNHYDGQGYGGQNLYRTAHHYNA